MADDHPTVDSPSLPELQQQVEQYRLALELNQIGTWDWHLDTGFVDWNESHYRLLGDRPGDYQPSYDAWRDRVHPEDIAKIETCVQNALAQQTDYEAEYRIIWRDGSLHWLRGYGRGFYDAMGQPHRMMGTITNITEHKYNEFVRQRAQAMLALPQLAEQEAEQTFLQQCLDWLESLTGSKISFLHFVNDQEQSIELITWSKRTLNDYCNAIYDKHYPVEQAGIWADALRQRQPIIFNDYSAHPHKHGLPQGHAQLKRLISSPVLSDGQVVMLTGVGNKSTDYTDTDVETVQLLSNEIWNIAKRRRALTTLAQQAQLLRATFEQAAVGLAQVSFTGEFLLVNQRFCEILGYTHEALNTLSCLDLLTLDESSQAFTDFGFLSSPPPNILEKAFHRPDGVMIWIALTVSLVRQEDSSPHYFLVVLEDISDRKQFELELEHLNIELEARVRERTQSLEESEERFRLAFEAASLGSWDWNLLTNEVVVSESLERMMGLEPGSFDGHLDTIISRIHPDDCAGILAAIHQGGHSEHPYEMEFRLMKPNGEVRWMVGRANTLRDVNGLPLRMIGVHVDITRRKEAEALLQQANAQLAQNLQELQERNAEMHLLSEVNNYLQSCFTIQEAGTAIAAFGPSLFPDSGGEIFVVNPETQYLERIAGWGSTLASEMLFTHQDCWALRLGHPHGTQSGQQELLCHHVKPDKRPAVSLCLPLMAQGETLGLLYVCTLQADSFKDSRQQLAQTVAEQVSLTLANIKLKEKLQQQSIHDPLTNLFNRRYLEEFLRKEIARATRENYGIALIMLDIDHFKTVNDQFGHDMGDYILKEIAIFLQTHLRQGDLACRYGGEEMLLILPKITLPDAHQRAEALRQEIANLPFYFQHQHLASVTVSFGITCFPELSSQIDELLKTADIALYQAKAGGRNQVVVYQPPGG
ncbi:MAG: diguanylate cyclase [Merismopediaceae bacterium]|nr:diguanylate cyclase [Merismopediaceae bacterium]